MKAIRLRTEYLKDPIGIDYTKPRLSWNCEGGEKQSAYEIEAKNENGEIVWQSGKVVSEKMHLIDWGGAGLRSRDRITWRVRLYDETDAAGEWSENAFFELGLLKSGDWSAKWITGDYRPKKGTRYPVDYFKKELSFHGNQVIKARIYVTACGLYEICINGEKAGDFCLAPGYTDYNKRVQYQTIDATNLFLGKEHCTVTAMLSDGWYRGSIGAHGLLNQYGTETKFLCQIELTFSDGTKARAVSDESWAWSNDGSIRFADNKDGEIVDANQTPSYGGKAKVTSHPVIPTASDNVPLIENEAFSPKITKSPSGKTILDFRQNIAGYVSFKVNAKRGQTMTLRFGELLDKDGELTLKNIQCVSKKKTTPLQEIRYTCKDGENTYKTRFSIFGFQYAEIVTDVDLSNAEFTAYAVYSGIEEIGFFESSNDLLNRFVEATKWSTKGNSADIPTDCPTRERHGWTGDAQIFYASAHNLFDYEAFMQKYLRDVFDWQKENGRLPQIAPYGGVDIYMGVMNGSVGWSDIGVLVPYRFWKRTGDRRILKIYYDRMKKYARFMQKRCGKWGGVYAKPTHVKGPYRKYIVNCGQSYDEWAEPQDVKAFVWTDFAEPHPEVSTAYTAHIMDLMIEIATELGKDQDIANYREYADGCRKAYQELVRTEAYSLDTDRQARLVRPLAFRLLDEAQRKFAKERLLTALENYGCRLGTGFLSTPLILDVLSEIDIDAAYRLLENEEIPGWLSMPKAGATTIWESWEGPDAVGEVASLNHYSKGALCEWLFEKMCGLQIAGENRFFIAPQPGGSFTFAEARTKSVYGEVSCRWEKTENGNYRYTVKIPANTTATFRFQNGEEKELSAGMHTLADNTSETVRE